MCNKFKAELHDTVFERLLETFCLPVIRYISELLRIFQSTVYTVIYFTCR
jgi:hypothetical protein